MQDSETAAVSVAAALKASKVVNCSFHMLQSAAVGSYEAATRLSICLFLLGGAGSGVGLASKAAPGKWQGQGAQGYRLKETFFCCPSASDVCTVLRCVSWQLRGHLTRWAPGQCRGDRCTEVLTVCPT